MWRGPGNDEVAAAGGASAMPEVREPVPDGVAVRAARWLPAIAHAITFPARYVINHFRYGYEANPYEVEARAAESTGGSE